ncbi:MAG: two-component system, chemotaxis family, protein-glutamate methylesterase/glutaminase [Acidimicrobiaceae bacterium]|jgi:two-component system chemotaxis response regulator CheB
MTTTTIRVLVVDEQPATRAEIARALEADGDVSVVGRCGHSGALELVRSLHPDVVALTGSAGTPARNALESIMAYAPTPTIVLRAADDLTPAAERSDIEAGAVGVLSWPLRPGDDGRLRERVRVLRGAVVVRHPRASLRSGRSGRTTHGRSCVPMVGMAASTGGPHTLAEVVRGLAGIEVPVLIVQHIHPEFIDGFVDWIRRAADAPVVAAEEGMMPEPGVFHIAPSGFHLKVGSDRRLRLDTEPGGLHCPSANELFLSMARSLGSASVGVLLTGMGDDGASGLLALHRAGGTTIVQDEATSAIFGMPRAAQELGAAGLVAPLSDIPRAVHEALGVRA